MKAAPSSDAATAKSKLESLNAEQIATLDDAIAKQKEYDKKFEDDVNAAIVAMFGAKTDWDVSKLNLGEDLTNLAVVTPAADPEHPFSLDEAGMALNAKGKIHVGDSWTFYNVLQDPKSGKWIDLKFKLVKAVATPEPYATSNHFDVDEITLSKIGLLNNKAADLSLNYGDYDITIQVDFLAHGTVDPIKITPLLVFADVDESQGVRIEEEKAVATLHGNRLVEDTDPQSKFFGSVRNTPYSSDLNDDGKDREYWAIFRLTETNSFTYTYFDGPGPSVIHSIGPGSLNYKHPQNKEHATASITLYKQHVTHSVNYRIVNDAPPADSVTAMPVEQAGLEHNSEVTIAEPLMSTSTLKGEVDGTWEFKGWFTDESLKTVADDFKITQDTTIYGAWDFTPNAYKVTHRFISGTKGIDLPEVLTERAPADQTGKTSGTIVEPETFDATDYEDDVNDGIWVFTGWDENSKKINKGDAHFIGTWTFTANTYTVAHEFISGTEGMNLPKDVTDLTPADRAGVLNKATVKPGEFKADPVKDPTHDGFWSFQSWDNTELTIAKGDAKFTGTWVYAEIPKPLTPEDPKKVSLARTGAQVGLLSGAALALLGSGAFLISQRRRSRATPGAQHGAK